MTVSLTFKGNAKEMGHKLLLLPTTQHQLCISLDWTVKSSKTK